MTRNLITRRTANPTASHTSAVSPARTGDGTYSALRSSDLLRAVTHADCEDQERYQNREYGSSWKPNMFMRPNCQTTAIKEQLTTRSILRRQRVYRHQHADLPLALDVQAQLRLQRRRSVEVLRHNLATVEALFGHADPAHVRGPRRLHEVAL